MGEPLKTFFSVALVRRLAGDIAREHPGFPVRAFTNDACRGLDALELLDRGRHIADALGAHLPRSYPEAIEIIRSDRLQLVDSKQRWVVVVVFRTDRLS